MAAPLLIAAALATALPWGAAPVSDVVFEAPGARDVAELRTVFGIAPGAVLSRNTIRRGVQALLATGEIEDVVVAVDPVDGVTLTVHVQVALRLRRLEVVGLAGREKRVVTEALALPLGAPLRIAHLEQRLAAAERALRVDRGFPDASLEPELDFDLAAGEVAVRVVGRLGPPRLLRGVSAEGADIEPSELWELCGLEEGQRLGGGAIIGARRRLAEHLRRKGYWEAEAEPPEVVPRGDGVGLRLRAVLGPHYRLEAEGIKPDKALARDALLFLSGEEPFEEAALETYVRQTRMYMQRQGRLLADVTADLIEEEGGERVLRLAARRTGKTRINEVRLLGDLPVPVEQLTSRIGVHEGGWVRRLTAEPVDENTLAEDADSLTATLRALGYAEARVAPARIVEAGDGVAVEFDIAEGPRTLTGTVELDGFPASIVVPDLPLDTGGPWSVEALADSRAALITALANAGYFEGEVEESHECAEQRCDVRFVARPGPLITVDQVVISGLARTSRAVVSRVLDLEPGRVAGLDEVLAAQRRLSALGIFERVTLRPIPGQSTGDRRGLVVEVAEGRTRAFGFGVGWNNEDRFRGSLNWAEANLLGTGRGLAIELRGSRREQFVQASLREPASVALLPVPAWLSLFYQCEVHADYSVTRRGSWLELGDRMRRPLRALLRYDYTIVSNDAPPEIQSDLEREQQNLALSSLTPILEWDTRDDLFSPRRGALASAQLLSSFDFLGADASLDRLILSFAGFAPLGRSVVAASLRAGGIHPRDPCDEPCPTDNLRVPVATRFYAGGRVTHRAFPTDGLGTPEVFDAEGRPIGGGGQLIANFEWRFPLYSVVGGNVFVDGGNVWPSWPEIDPGALRWGAGLGLRVDTPVGPFRLEYGWKLDRMTGESPGEWFFSFGNPF